MRITFLGHAGFLVETESAVVVADPWLSAHGAFASAWMQFPKNHHLAPVVRASLADKARKRFVYISHEHKDHYDPDFLSSLEDRDVTVLVPELHRKVLERQLRGLGFDRVIALGDGQAVEIPGGYIKLYVEDSVLNRDSALLVRWNDQTFFDVNDCKLHDRIGQIARTDGPVDVFTAQFSGAIWHPTCYEYEPETYRKISRQKMFSKFEAVARSLEVLSPHAYLASAGPACFLDPQLMHLNFEQVNIFPQAQKLFDFLKKRLKNRLLQLVEPMPGDVLEVVDAALGGERVRAVHKVEPRMSPETFGRYIAEYAEDSRALYSARSPALSEDEVEQVWSKLKTELSTKARALNFSDRTFLPVFVRLKERLERWAKVDLGRSEVSEVASLGEGSHYALTVSAKDLLPVLDRKMTWDELMLSFRFKLSRNPDVYEPVVHGFLCIEAEDLPDFKKALLATEARQERITLEVGGKQYSVLRFCPHQGADLTGAWTESGRYLVCPRHRWRFDMQNQGACSHASGSVRARPETSEKGESTEKVEPAKRAESAEPVVPGPEQPQA